MSHRAHKLCQHEPQSMQQEDECRYLQITGSRLNHRRLRGIQPHDLRRKEPGNSRKQDCKSRRKPQRHGKRFIHSLPIACAPILGTQHAAAANDPKIKNHKEIVILICQAGRRQSHLSERSQHHCIKHIHAHIDRLLQRNREHNRKNRLIEGLVPYNRHFSHKNSY